jgi:hypothetical protein
MKRENIVGRANVEDTPALEAYCELKKRELARLERRQRDRALVPQPSVPILKWRDVVPMVRGAAELVSARSRRRVIWSTRPQECRRRPFYTGVQMANLLPLGPPQACAPAP